ncbi:cold-shock protein [Parabacteroides hominis]|uniref:Cold shock domain-containing protein n=1 Tax=Parabacteroides hominis TaxID=2763057 RepID=A0ABR7DKP5_9BACT|nr:cold shock domain-containing protein [Parabacteroides hominis]MBC5632005.1 cold shock domain-containing protein [Parabacteroides hominis]MBD9168283.1 cold shock domain-containing protein [Parabacteroides johnsonii]
MAKSVTYNKRENEKKKQARRAEKQKKKEDRKLSGKVNSFDDMIAYVDENGVITSTPPELNPNKEEIKQEEILISTPKKEEIEAPAVLRGRIDYFNESKGYGFIKDLDSAEKYFFHVSNNTLTNISESDIVTFDLERGLRGMNAINIRLEDESEN